MIIHKSNRFYELDALRGLAAISVCLFHFNLFRYGCTGVDLFFIISGFVIFMSIINANSIKTFFISRFIRLFPSYWLSIIIAFITIPILEKHLLPIDFKFLLGNLTMMQPLFKTTYLNGVYWTLYVELMFYFAIAVIWKFKKLRSIETIIVIGLIMTAILNGAYFFCKNENPQFARLFIILRSLIPLVSHLHSFSAGIIFYVSYQSGVNLRRLTILLFTILVTAISHTESVMINSYLNTVEHTLIYAIFIIMFLVLIGRKKKFYKIAFFSFLGNISYPIYLIHSMVGVALKDFLTPIIGLNYSIIIGLLSTFILSTIITYWFDIPIRLCFKNLIKNN
jgi:peptidoglycan/LPS O-acetylase OafA/YrhL